LFCSRSDGDLAGRAIQRADRVRHQAAEYRTDLLRPAHEGLQRIQIETHRRPAAPATHQSGHVRQQIVQIHALHFRLIQIGEPLHARNQRFNRCTDS
jgi:hypothetical protein